MDANPQVDVEIALSRESIRDLWDEITPLLQRHKDEIAFYPDIELKVNRGLYENAEDFDGLRCFTARTVQGNTLIGYAVFFVKNNPHYMDSKQAVQDVLFVDKPFRRGFVGKNLVEWCDDQLREEGCQVVYHHVKVDHPALGQLLERIGYVKQDIIFSKRLDR